MTLRHIVTALGGELYAGGVRALVPAPGHSPGDRSVSLLLSEGRVVVHCFGGADWREVRDHLRELGLIDAEGRPAGSGAATAPPRAPAPPSGRVRQGAAARLWAEGRPIAPGGPVAAYLARRAAQDASTSAALRAHPAAPLSLYRYGRRRAPALLAAVTAADGSLTAVKVTYLDQDGRRLETLRTPRKLAGLVPPGAAVRLQPAGPELAVAEGVFTALSAGRWFGRPAWALLSATLARAWTPPPGVRRVILAADRDRAGWGVAGLLVQRLAARGVSVEAAFAPGGFNDWNDWDMAARR